MILKIEEYRSMPKALVLNSRVNSMNEEISKRIMTKWGKCKRTAMTLNRKFTLTYNQIHLILSKGCHYCNIPVIWHSGYSIDRKDCEKGYTVYNSVACCKECNYIKGKRSYSEMLNLSKTKDFEVLKKHTVPRWQNRIFCRYKMRRIILNFYTYEHSYLVKMSQKLYLGKFEWRALKFWFEGKNQWGRSMGEYIKSYS